MGIQALSKKGSLEPTSTIPLTETKPASTDVNIYIYLLHDEAESGEQGQTNPSKCKG